MEGGNAAAEPATAGWIVISQLGSFLSTFLSPFPFLIGFEMSEKIFFFLLSFVLDVGTFVNR